MGTPLKPLKDETIVRRLQQATRQNDFNAFTELVARMGVLHRFEPYGSFLHYACASKDLAQIEYLLDRGAKLSLKNKQHLRPLNLLLNYNVPTPDMQQVYPTEEVDLIAGMLIDKGAPYLEAAIFRVALQTGLPSLTERFLDNLSSAQQKLLLNNTTPVEVCVQALLGSHSSEFIFRQAFKAYNAYSEGDDDLDKLSHGFQTLDTIVRHPTFQQIELLTDEWVRELSQIKTPFGDIFDLNALFTQLQGITNTPRVNPEDNPIAMFLKDKFLQYRMEKQLPTSPNKGSSKFRL